MKNHSLKAPRTPIEAFTYATQFDTEVKKRMRNLSFKFIQLVKDCKDGNPKRVVHKAITEEFDRLKNIAAETPSSDDFLDLAAISQYSIREKLIDVLLKEERAEREGN